MHRSRPINLNMLDLDNVNVNNINIIAICTLYTRGKYCNKCSTKGMRDHMSPMRVFTKRVCAYRVAALLPPVLKWFISCLFAIVSFESPNDEYVVTICGQPRLLCVATRDVHLEARSCLHQVSRGWIALTA